MANPFPFTAGQVLTAAQMNGIGETTSFTPSFTQFTLGNGTVNYATYVRVQNLIVVQLKVTLGSTSSFAGSSSFTCPVTPDETSQFAIGVVRFNDATGEEYLGVANMSAGNIQMRPLNAGVTYLQFTTTSSVIPFTWATNDSFTLTATYRVA